MTAKLATSKRAAPKRMTPIKWYNVLLLLVVLTLLGVMSFFLLR